MTGRCDQRPELADVALPFEVAVPVLLVGGGEPVLRSLLEPLGYTAEAVPIVLDDEFPGWGPSRYWSVCLTSEVCLADRSSHLHVLLSVLDDERHYWVGGDDARKLLDTGGPSLASHPTREMTIRRCLKRRRSLANEVVARLVGDAPDEALEADETNDREEKQVEEHISLSHQCLNAVTAAVIDTGASRVLDLGCGEGRLFQILLKDPQVSRVTDASVSTRALERAADRLDLDYLSGRQRERTALIQAGLTNRNSRVAAFDAATLIEAIERLDAPRLASLEQVTFCVAHAAPPTVIVTPPSHEHDVRFEWLPASQLCRRDHQFEWTCAAFTRWAGGVATTDGDRIDFAPIGPDDSEADPSRQTAGFAR